MGERLTVSRSHPAASARWHESQLSSPLRFIALSHSVALHEPRPEYFLAGRGAGALRGQHPLKWKLGLKRTIDLVLGGTAAILSLPVMCAIAIAVKLDSTGPILYGSIRVGRKGRSFTCYKFRTMCPDADCIKAKLRLINERHGAFFKLKNDPRVTR